MRGSANAPVLLEEAVERPTRGSPVIADVVSFRTRWATGVATVRRILGPPTVWIELCFTPRAEHWTIRKRWSWIKSGARVEGSQPLVVVASLEQARTAYADAVATQLGRDFSIVSRRIAHWSPARHISICADETPIVERVRSLDQLRRRGADWDL